MASIQNNFTVGKLAYSFYVMLKRKSEKLFEILEISSNIFPLRDALLRRPFSVSGLFQNHYYMIIRKLHRQ